MKKYIILIVISVFVFGKNLNAAEYDHSILSKLIKSIGGERITDQMAGILAKKPLGVVYLKDAFDKANLYSMIICNVQGEKRHSRDEVDAVRHFIGSSILTAYFGDKFARDLLTEHEKRSSTFNDENYMDLRNNEVGINFGSKIPLVMKTRRVKVAGQQRFKKVRYKVLDTSVDFFRIAVKNKLEMGELTTLDTSSSSCARPDIYPNF